MMLQVEPLPLKRPAAEELVAQPKVKKRLFGRSLSDAIGIDAQQIVSSSKTDAVEKPEETLEHKSPTPAEKDKPQCAPNAPQPSQTETDSALRDGQAEQRPVPERPAEDVPTSVGSQTCTGKRFHIYERKNQTPQSYERMIAERSTTAAGKATRSYYGVDIHSLIEQAKAIDNMPKPEAPPAAPLAQPAFDPGAKSKKKHAMWTEKYRARRFIDLVGDERTHRSVLKWLKAWDSIVFPGATKPKARWLSQEEEEERAHRKILLLTGPPGLGKTTLAHVCARQAGYEAVEINASDERSRDIVRGRIRDCVGTENVRGTTSKVGESTVRKAGKPVCVVVDEVDGVVSGSGGSGDGGFMKALIDLVHLDQKNSQHAGTSGASRKGKKGDNFRLLRPMILICNDVYHPSLRPLRTSNLAEIVHIRKPPLDKVVARLKTVFVKEGIQADNDAVRRLCEATWGVSSRKDDQGSRAGGEGDMRGVLVTAEWACSKLRATCAQGEAPRLSRSWLEKNILNDLASGGGPRGAGRGSARETAERVFMQNAGFSKSTVASNLAGPRNTLGSVESVSDANRANALALLRTAVETTGDSERVLTEIFTTYASRQFQDDNYLSKPNAASEWLHFHDLLSSRVRASQEWELNPYLSASVLGFHHLFGSATSARSATAAPGAGQDGEAPAMPFQGPRADFEAYEAHKQSLGQLQALHGALSLPLSRTFRSPAALATELLPSLNRMLAPAVNPVVVGGSGENRGMASVRREAERRMVERGAGAMCAAGVGFERARVEDGSGTYGGFIYRMEPPIDALSTFETRSKDAAGGPGAAAPARYAVRQVLEQEHKKLMALQSSEARQARFAAGSTLAAADQAGVGQVSSLAQLRTAQQDKENTPPGLGLAKAAAARGAGVKRDFFGRIIPGSAGPTGPGSGGGTRASTGKARIWVSYHEGFSNAVRKPIGLKALLDSL